MGSVFKRERSNPLTDAGARHMFAVVLAEAASPTPSPTTAPGIISIVEVSMTWKDMSKTDTLRGPFLLARVFVFLILAPLVTFAQHPTGSRFLPAVTYSSGGSFGNAVAVGDLNGDGKPDLVVANGYNADNNGGVAVLLGNGDGTFQPGVTYDSGGTASFANSIAIADVNGDGKLDLVVADSCNDSDCKNGSWVAVLLGNGDGTFQKAVKRRSGGAAWAVVVADVNGDGTPDLIVGNVCSGTNDILTCTEGGSVAVLLGTGNGEFMTAQTYNMNEPGSYSLSVGDLNGDGKLDVIMTSFCTDQGCANGGDVGVFLGNGDGTFQPVVTYMTGGFANAVAVADLNGDGKLDVAVANGGSDTVSVFLGNGDGTLQAPTIYSSAGYAYAIAIGDVNQDGKPDLVVTTGDYTMIGEVSILPGDGNGRFRSPIAYSTLEFGADSVAIADLNGDGRPDLAVANYCNSSSCTAGRAGSVAVLLHAGAH
jgi:uncharacterized protein (DUF2141 family)